MSLRVRLKIDAKCFRHPRYNPARDGRPSDSSCPGCESVFCIWLYARIARNKAEKGEGLARHIEPETPEPGRDGSQGGDAANATAAIEGADDQGAP
jgi:hypothetical protein